MKFGHIIFLLVLVIAGYALGARKPGLLPIVGVK